MVDRGFRLRTKRPYLRTAARIGVVPQALLNPQSTWKNAPDYDAKAAQLAELFRNNFKTYAAQVTEAVRGAGP